MPFVSSVLVTSAQVVVYCNIKPGKMRGLESQVAGRERCLGGKDAGDLVFKKNVADISNDGCAEFCNLGATIHFAGNCIP